MGKGAQERRLGDYVVERLIGVGGMAEVYLGRAVSGAQEGRLVAIKRPKPDLASQPEILDRFLDEADLARLIVHPAVVEVLGAGMLNDTPYLVMEYVDGPDLGIVSERAKRTGVRLPVPVCVHVMGRVLEAAAVIHDSKGRDGTPLGVVHCDMNPANVFLSRDGEIKVGDLGVALVGAMGGGIPERAAVGKLSYLSPEQAMGARIDRRTDLFSIGVMLFELLTGERPFRISGLDDLPSIVRAGPSSAIGLRSDLPEGLDEVIRKALSHEPADRFRTAEAFREALDPFADASIGNSLAVAALVRGLFPAKDAPAR